MWWHDAVGARLADPSAGNGMRIGIVDTAFRAEAGLEHVTVLDVRGRSTACKPTVEPPHGEMVARLIGQRMSHPNQFGGIAPGATVIAIDASGPRNELNVVKATNAIVRLATHHGCHLINLSAGRGDDQPGLREAARQAASYGALCIVAAGNDQLAQVAYPARYPECVAVGGIGRRGWGPVGTMVRRFSDFADTQAGCRGKVEGVEVFHDPNSCYGEGLDVVAPSVGLVICRGTVAAATALGTSFAAPLVTGVLAAELGNDGVYRDMAGGPARAVYARSVLESICRRTGISLERESHGVPRLSR